MSDDKVSLLVGAAAQQERAERIFATLCFFCERGIPVTTTRCLTEAWVGEEGERYIHVLHHEGSGAQNYDGSRVSSRHEFTCGANRQRRLWAGVVEVRPV